MTKLKSAKEKLNELIDIMPFELSESIRPYILEYGKILQQNAIEAALEVAANEAKVMMENSCNDHTPYMGECQSCGEYHTYEQPTENVDKQSITSLINHKDLKL